MHSIMKKNSIESVSIEQLKKSCIDGMFIIFFCSPFVRAESYQQDRSQKLYSPTLTLMRKELTLV